MKATVLYEDGRVAQYELVQLEEGLYECEAMGPLVGATISWPAIDGRPYGVVLKEMYL